ncbi:MAG: DEAD/DEAH box helicase [Methanobacteriota archaeon]
MSEEVLDALRMMGFSEPTPIQKLAIPPILQGRDLIGQAQTGTGKTAAFGIPLVEKMHPEWKKPHALVLVPTRELAEQVAGEVNEIGQVKAVEATAIYGGASMTNQVNALKAGVQIVVGTPGRIMDHMRRRTLDLRELRALVLDEADRMLDMGFIDDINWILARCPREGVQTLLFSATMPAEILELSKRYMDQPAHVAVRDDKLTVDTTEEVYINVGYRNKVWALYRVLESEKPELAIVFCRTKIECDKVARILKGHGYNAEALHGDMTQGARNKVMEQVREKKVRVLIATDVAARGLDVPHTSHVINYDIPEDPDWYVHRIGRTGRMGRAGKAITFVTSEEERTLMHIETRSGSKLRYEPVPEVEGRDRIRYVEDWKEKADPTGMVHFRLSVGRDHGITMIGLFRAINKAAGLRENDLGPVKVHPTWSDVAVPWALASRVFAKLKGARLGGREVEVALQEEETSPT